MRVISAVVLYARNEAVVVGRSLHRSEQLRVCFRRRWNINRYTVTRCAAFWAHGVVLKSPRRGDLERVARVDAVRHDDDHRGELGHLSEPRVEHALRVRGASVVPSRGRY